MKTSLTIAILTLCCALNAADSKTNLVSVYLLERPLAKPWPKLDSANLKNLRISSPPVLSDSDFVAFDTSNHKFTVTARAAERLAKTIWTLGKQDAPGWGGDSPTVLRTGDYELIPSPAPFVLMVSSEPIYAGAFYTPYSSSSFDGPVIMPTKLFIKTNVSPSTTFEFSIQLGYPGSFGGTPDPRADPRLVKAVRELFGASPK